MYEEFYGLKEKPFNIIPNPEYLYLSTKHSTALTYLEYGLRDNIGFILLTGDIGTGKTTLIRYLLKKISDDMEIAVIFNTNISADELIKLIMQEYGLECVNEKSKNIDILYQFLIEKYTNNKRVLLIIDEAQNLNYQALEEIRMLSNLQTDENSLIQIILVGQPELNRKVQNPQLTQLAQRIAVMYHLSPLSFEETKEYVKYRIEKAGTKDSMFTEEAYELLYKEAKGIPRLLNILCDSSLVYGFADEKDIIDQEIIYNVINDKRDILKFIPEAENLENTNNDNKLDYMCLQNKIVALEERVYKIDSIVEWQLQEMKTDIDQYKDKIITNLEKQLNKEKLKTNRLSQMVIKYKNANLSNNVQNNNVNNNKEVENKEVKYKDIQNNKKYSSKEINNNDKILIK